jgi:hypothetical protein
MVKLILLVTTFALFVTSPVVGQSVKQHDALEREIRKLDLAEADAIQRRDFAELNKLLAEDFTVNSPRNEIVKGRERLCVNPQRHRQLLLIRARAGGRADLRKHSRRDGA